jgi:hypothetical protein
MKYCHKCLAEWTGFSQPGTRENCAKCGEDLHVCRNCRLFNEHKPNQCMVETDPVLNKERANYCEEFEFADRPLPAKKDPSSSSTNTREQWDRLFKKKNT